MGRALDRVPMEPILGGERRLPTWCGIVPFRRVGAVHEGNTSAPARNLECVARGVRQKDRWIGVEDIGQAQA